MKKLFQKKSLVALGLGLVVLLIAPSPAGAYLKVNANEKAGLNTGFNEVGLGKGDVQGTTASIINIILGILGIIAVIMVVAGGFMMMTAGGNEDKVGQGKKIIVQGAIGLVIIFAAWGIATFVINQLGQATSNNVPAAAAAKHCSNKISVECTDATQCVFLELTPPQGVCQ